MQLYYLTFPTEGIRFIFPHILALLFLTLKKSVLCMNAQDLEV